MKCKTCQRFTLQRHPFYEEGVDDPEKWPIEEDCRIWPGNGIEYAWTVCKGSEYIKKEKEIQLTLW